LQRIKQPESPSTSGIKLEPIPTAGEVFPDALLELVSTRGGEDLQLLLYKNRQQTVRPEIETNRGGYVPLQMDSSLRRAMRFPSVPTGRLQPSLKLPAKIQKIFEEHFGLMSAESALLTGFSLSTWFQEMWWRPPQLVILGWEMDLAVQLLCMLGCFVRHPLMLAGVERAQAIAPLMQLQPTLLLNQPEMAPRLLQLLGDSNYRELSVPGARGALLRFAGPRAIYLGTNSAEFPAFRISLSAASRRPFLSELDWQRIADDFQPQLLSYRLQHWQEINSARVSITSSRLGVGLPDLQCCVMGDEELAATLAEAVEAQRDDLRTEIACRPEAALVEILWSPAHKSAKIAVKEITSLFNALRRSRGERDEYNEVEIGVMLSKLGFDRRRNGAGMVVRFSGKCCRIVHALAGQFAVNVAKVPECTICSGA
jgi:hypothetical protein